MKNQTFTGDDANVTLVLEPELYDREYRPERYKQVEKQLKAFECECDSK